MSETSFSLIDRMVAPGQHMSLRAWASWAADRNEGVWVALAGNPYVFAEVIDGIDDGDLHGTCIREAILQTEWLPIAAAATLVQALERLERVLARVPTEMATYQSPWYRAVEQAYERVGRLWMKRDEDTMTPLLEDPLPRTLEGALASLK
jgi:hypothetical protein